MPAPQLTDVHGVGPISAEALNAAGIQTVGALARASVARIEQVPGFTAARATRIKQNAQATLTAGAAVTKKAPARSAPKKAAIKRPDTKKPEAKSAQEKVGKKKRKKASKKNRDNKPADKREKQAKNKSRKKDSKKKKAKRTKGTKK